MRVIEKAQARQKTGVKLQPNIRWKIENKSHNWVGAIQFNLDGKMR